MRRLFALAILVLTLAPATPAKAEVITTKYALAEGTVTRPDATGQVVLKAFGQQDASEPMSTDIDVSLYVRSTTGAPYTYIEQDGGYPHGYHQKGLQWGHLTLTDPNACMYSDEGDCTHGLLEGSFRYDGYGPRRSDGDGTYRSCTIRGWMSYNGTVLLRARQISPLYCELEVERYDG